MRVVGIKGNGFIGPIIDEPGRDHDWAVAQMKRMTAEAEMMGRTAPAVFERTYDDGERHKTLADSNKYLLGEKV